MIAQQVTTVSQIPIQLAMVIRQKKSPVNVRLRPVD